LPRFKTTPDIMKIIQNKEQIRNIGIIAHVDHDFSSTKTAPVFLLTDSALTGQESTQE